MDKFDKFLSNRQTLLYQYIKGDLTKKEFLDLNYSFIFKLDLNPFKKVDNVKKAVYNYQYYNILAKYYQSNANELSYNDVRRQDFISQSLYYYNKKDQTTLKLLNLINFKNVEAYFVKVKSLNLKNKLFEIVISDPDVLLELSDGFYLSKGIENSLLILHSKSTSILKVLKEEGVFLEKQKKSIIDNYINQKY